MIKLNRNELMPVNFQIEVNDIIIDKLSFERHMDVINRIEKTFITGILE
jgi:hypothetical protein